MEALVPASMGPVPESFSKRVSLLNKKSPPPIQDEDGGEDNGGEDE